MNLHSPGKHSLPCKVHGICCCPAFQTGHLQHIFRLIYAHLESRILQFLPGLVDIILCSILASHLVWDRNANVNIEKTHHLEFCSLTREGSCKHGQTSFDLDTFSVESTRSLGCTCDTILFDLGKRYFCHASLASDAGVDRTF